MDTITAVLEVPDWITEGLASDLYERYGGVIRDTSNGQIVAMLHDGSEGSAIPFSPVQTVGMASKLLTGTNAVGVLSLAVNAIGFTVLYRQVKGLEVSISEQSVVLTQINRKLDLSVYGNFVAAIQQAKNAFVTQNPDTKRIGAMNAVNRFLAAQHYFSTLTETEIKASNPLADKLLSTTFLSHIAEVRCHLELDEPELALIKLKEAKETLRNLTQLYLIEKYKEIDTQHLWCLDDEKVRGNLIQRIKVLEDAISDEFAPKPSGSASSSMSANTSLLPQKIIDTKEKSSKYREQESTLSHWREERKKAETKEKQLAAGISNANNVAFAFLALLKTLPSNQIHSNREWKVKSIEEAYARERLEKSKYYSEILPLTLQKAEAVMEDMMRLESYQAEIEMMLQHNMTFQQWQNLQPESNSPDGFYILLVPESSPAITINTKIPRAAAPSIKEKDSPVDSVVNKPSQVEQSQATKSNAPWTWTASPYVKQPGQTSVDKKTVAPSKTSDRFGTRLVAMGGPYRGQSFEIHQSLISIGRDSINTIILSNDAAVLSFHALIILSGTQHWIRNVSSSTRIIYVNGKLVKGECPLSIGDIIGIGETALRYE